MFKLIRPRHVIKQYAGKKFPNKPRKDITDIDIIEKFNVPNIVDKKTNITTIGSCFAQRLRDWLINNNFNFIDGHWDRVYSPRTIKQTLQMAFEPENLKIVEPIWDFNGDWGEPYIKSPLGRPLPLPNNIEDAKLKQLEYYKHFNKVLSECEVLIVTYGQTEVWSHKEAPDTAFYAAPFTGIKDGDKNHICKDLSIDEIKNETKEIIRLMNTYNPNCKLIFSISPIPLTASISNNYSAYIAANHAKTKLHACVLETIPNYKDVYYMPSFEWVNAHPYHAFESDGRHVPQTFANSIMEIFKKLYVK